MKTRGIAHKYGDNVDTDVIIPARYLNTASAAELAKHCMEDIDSGFAGSVKSGDVIVGGENFGCGSSREHAPLAIKASGTGCVIAKSFARIFYRNAVNIGLPILECPEASEKIGAGDLVEIDFDAGEVFNLTKDEKYASEPFPPFVQDIIEAGGLLNSLKSSGAAKKTTEESSVESDGKSIGRNNGKSSVESSERDNRGDNRGDRTGGVGCE